MNAFLFFIFIITVVSVAFILGHKIGYLAGKAEVSNIPRSEPPEVNLKPPEVECLHHELRACARYEQKG